jgi:hypothetical protein
MNDKPIGTQIPVMATAVDRRMFAFKDLIEVDRPPVYCKNLYPASREEISHTYLHKSRVSGLDTQSAGSLFLSLDRTIVPPGVPHRTPMKSWPINPQ